MIAGRFRGRPLKAPRGAMTTRPTSDRVREACFSMLGELDGMVVLDLFAGTGALGIEALSRGAERAVFVERDSTALRVLRTNLDSLGLVPAVAEVRAGEALAALRAAREARETYDLIFVDPPYSRAREIEGELSARLPAVLGARARVVVESERRAPLRLALAVERERRYGDTVITIHRGGADSSAAMEGEDER
ncbi:MAG TPA: 16S rRNA (guanine(966)-N(2))-methyltransferase RsmD [Solirubrobacteraceae bacterium]